MASAVIGDLRVNLGADTAQFSSGLNKARTDLKSFSKEVANSNSSSAGGMRNLALQLSQVSQQTSATGNLVQALAIQLPDMTVGFGTAGIAAGILAGAMLPLIANLFSGGGAVNSLSSEVNSLAGQASSLDGVASAITELKNLQKTYAEAIVNSGKAQASATALILANTEKEFNAKKSLLELELKRQKASIMVQRAELQSVGNDLKRQIGKGVTNPVGAVAGGFSDPRIGDFVQNPNTAGVLEKTQGIIEKSGLGDKLTEIRANIDLTEASTSTLEDALNTTFSGGVKNADALKAAWEDASKGGDKLAERYQTIVARARAKIAADEAERASIGLSEQASLRLRYGQELLNQAQMRGITLTAAQKNELAGLAGQMAVAEIATKTAKETFDFARETVGSFVSDLKSGLQKGESFWESFRNAAANALDKIADKLLNQVLDALFTVDKAASGISFGGGGSLFGGLIGGIGKLFGFANGGSFNVGGSGGIDSQIVAFRASPNETVSVTKPGQVLGNGAMQAVHVTVGLVKDGLNLYPEVVSVAQAVSGSAIGQYNRAVPGRVSQAQLRGTG